ncbi:MAG: hypothetical protein HKO64_02105 [Xanthomonadales bacterium]|nr:hypothetical protein [Gammaproteobacteria bacterium]NNE06681.1 hypothetical protein [Xanthomonadales bacterium]NNL94393.1 hypothetical protein [Xanthomonadales bacterium]
MHSTRIFVVTLLAVNLLLLGIEASKPRVQAGSQTDQLNLGADEVPGLVTVSEMPETPSIDHGLECFTVGPFENARTSGVIAQMLGDHASRVDQRTTEAFVDRGYWVYLPPVASVLEGKAAVNQFLDAGIEDVRLLESGEFNNAVSLGYFFEQSNAARRRDLARAMGFEVEMKIQRQDETRFWVDYRQLAGVEYAYRILADVVPGELHRQTICPNPAQAEPSAGAELAGLAVLRKLPGMD